MAKEFVESVGFCVMAVALLWLYCKVTPDQLSGESDWTAEALGICEAIAASMGKIAFGEEA